MNFRVGQKVVCVTNKRAPELTRNCVYTVAAICGERPGLVLAEVDPRFPYCCFDHKRFRPVRTTDISIFTAMLTPIPHKELTPQD